MLIFVSPYFQFSLRAEAVMVACLSFVIRRTKETIKKQYNGFSKSGIYYSLALFLLTEASCMQSNLGSSRQRLVPSAHCSSNTKLSRNVSCTSLYFCFNPHGGGVSKTIKKLKVFDCFC